MPQRSDEGARKERRRRKGSNPGFPSDALTLGQLRAQVNGEWHAAEILAHNIIQLEMELVSGAKARGRPASTETERITNILREQKAQELAALYVEVGLAGGEHEANQLIEKLETAARDAGKG